MIDRFECAKRCNDNEECHWAVALEKLSGDYISSVSCDQYKIVNKRTPYITTMRSSRHNGVRHVLFRKVPLTEAQTLLTDKRSNVYVNTCVAYGKSFQTSSYRSGSKELFPVDCVNYQNACPFGFKINSRGAYERKVDTLDGVNKCICKDPADLLNSEGDVEYGDIQMNNYTGRVHQNYPLDR